MELRDSTTVADPRVLELLQRVNGSLQTVVLIGRPPGERPVVRVLGDSCAELARAGEASHGVRVDEPLIASHARELFAHDPLVAGLVSAQVRSALLLAALVGGYDIDFVPLPGTADLKVLLEQARRFGHQVAHASPGVATSPLDPAGNGDPCPASRRPAVRSPGCSRMQV